MLAHSEFTRCMLDASRRSDGFRSYNAMYVDQFSILMANNFIELKQTRPYFISQMPGLVMFAYIGMRLFFSHCVTYKS